MSPIGSLTFQTGSKKNLQENQQHENAFQCEREHTPNECKVSDSRSGARRLLVGLRVRKQ